MNAVCLFTIFLCSVGAISGEDKSTSCRKLQKDNDSGAIEGESNVAEAFCTLQISVASRNQISLTFTQAKLERAVNHLLNFVLVLDGPDCMSPRLGLSYDQYKPTLISSAKSLTALFVANYPNQNFRAIYSAVGKTDTKTPQAPWSTNRIFVNCGAEMNQSRGKLQFKGDIIDNVVCIWRLTVKAHERVLLRINVLKISFQGSWLRVLNGDNCDAPELTYLPAFANTSIVKVSSSSNVMMVIYASAAVNADEEFEANYWSIPAGIDSATLTPADANTPADQSGRSQMDVTEFANSSAMRHKFRVLCAIIVHTGYYLFWIMTT